MTRVRKSGESEFLEWLVGISKLMTRWKLCQTSSAHAHPGPDAFTRLRRFVKSRTSPSANHQYPVPSNVRRTRKEAIYGLRTCPCPKSVTVVPHHYCICSASAFAPEALHPGFKDRILAPISSPFPMFVLLRSKARPDTQMFNQKGRTLSFSKCLTPFRRLGEHLATRYPRHSFLPKNISYTKDFMDHLQG